MSQLELTTEINPIQTTKTSDQKSPYNDSIWRLKRWEAIGDIVEGTKLWRVWWYMAMADIRRRYRRTLLGPFWTTLSLAIFIGFMSLLFSYLWKMELSKFLPFFSAGFICWTLISTIITESCHTFVSLEGLLKQISLPYSTCAWLVVARNLIVLAHHSIVFVLIMLFLQLPVTLNTLYFIPAMLLLCLTGVWVAIIVGLVCARYRDLQQVVNSVLQISLFLTPIFWPPAQLAGTRAIVLLNANPLYHYVNVIRTPLLGQAPDLLSWQIVIACTCLGWVFTLILFQKKRKNLIFWL